MTERDFLRSELLKSVNEKLINTGFSMNKAQGEFTRKDKEGWCKYQLIFLKRDAGWEINPAMLIRKNVIEDIFHKTSGFETKYQKGTPTVGASIENYLKNGKSYRFPLTEEDQINEVALRLFTLFEKIALPFFAKFNSIDALDKVINENPADTTLTGDIFKGSKGIILARVTNRNNFEELVHGYTRHYERLAYGFYLEGFKSLLRDLSQSRQ